MLWPLQRDCDTFYGNPRGANGAQSAAWAAANLTYITAPFQLYFDGKPVARIRIHKKCADSLRRVFERIWEAAGRSQAVVDEWGASKYAGSVVHRNKRKGGTLSMHAYGCAIDLDPARNGMGNTRPNFGRGAARAVVEAFESEGWTWGGNWEGRNCDGMHFQAAYTQTVAKSMLRAAGSRTIAATSQVKSNAGMLTGALAFASTTAAQINDLHGQVGAIQDAIENGQNLITVLSDHWKAALLIMSLAVAAYNLWRIFHGASEAEQARIDDAQAGTPGDQVLYDNPVPGDPEEGFEYDWSAFEDHESGEEH
jgi:hypothetical protein